MEHAIEILIEDVRAGKVSHEEVVEWIRCAKDELRQMEDAERELNRQCEELGREAKVAEARLAGSEAELVNQILNCSEEEDFQRMATVIRERKKGATRDALAFYAEATRSRS
uniref:Uncharacterized protein n=1 Tax=Rhodosorus marinus TaxID=101924 RepID=A0A7S2ZKI6_9RHOD|mmetsp:Transcript_229/g.571  ORF Transcript_229/g.571 Transcript_229/m.571 type:complete len:112 (+) Transcript_229:1861-2196(+)